MYLTLLNKRHATARRRAGKAAQVVDTSLETARQSELLQQLNEEKEVKEGADPTILNAKAFDDLTEVDMGMFWNPAVKAWLELEKAYDYASPKTGNLSTTNHPKEIANWIKYGRKPSAAPTFEGEEALGKIAKEFWAWWKALQPSWRVWP